MISKRQPDYVRHYGPHATDEPYQLTETHPVIFTSRRFSGKTLTLEGNETSDGATGAWDIESWAWWFHDLACKRPAWDDGTPITAWQAAMILNEILWWEGRTLRGFGWPAATFLMGCYETRKNGWF